MRFLPAFTLARPLLLEKISNATDAAKDGRTRTKKEDRPCRSRRRSKPG